MNIENSNSSSNPLLNISQNQNPNLKPILEMKENIRLPGDVKITEDTNTPYIESMGKKNILEWVRDNMPGEMENIVDVRPEKITDEHGDFQWELLDVKQPKASKKDEEETKTFLQIQTNWIITTKDGQVRRAGQFLTTGVLWPKDDSSQQLEAIRRATIAIDLYTQTMSRPLYKKDNELPKGFRFADLVNTSQLTVGLRSTGALKDKMRVEIATPRGQGGKAKALTYQLSEMVNRTAATIFDRDKINFGMVDKLARHAVVKESNGRIVNPEDREAYLADEQLNEFYDELIADQVLEKDIYYTETIQDILTDQPKFEHLLAFIGKERERHIIDFNVVNGAIHSGPKTRTGAWFASLKKVIGTKIISCDWGKTQQQLLAKHLEDKKNLESFNNRVNKQQERVEDLQQKVEDLQGTNDPAELKKKVAYSNQLKSAYEELTKLHNEQMELENDFDESEGLFVGLVSRMESAYEFLENKMKQCEHLAIFIAAKAAGAGKDHVYHIGQIAEKYTLNELLQAGKDNLTAAEHYFISTFLGTKGDNGVMPRKGMAEELKNMAGIIDEVREKLGWKKTPPPLGFELEEI